MSTDYAVLAPIYDKIGMADFATEITPRLLRYAQENEWMGRRILDLGCGTGASSIWFATHNYYVVSVDHAPAMLDTLNSTIAQRSFSNIRVLNMDIRALQIDEVMDMALAIDVLNDLESLKELEGFFQQVHANLPANRWFIFDMHTTEGLVQSSLAGDLMIHNDDSLVVFARTHYDYERLMHTQTYHIFQNQADGAWERSLGQRVVRAYPIQAVANLLRRQKFEVISVTNTRLTPIDSGGINSPRVIFVAKRL